MLQKSFMEIYVNNKMIFIEINLQAEVKLVARKYALNFILTENKILERFKDCILS